MRVRVEHIVSGEHGDVVRGSHELARTLFASIRSGTLVLEAEDGDARAIVGVYPLTLCECHGIQSIMSVAAGMGGGDGHGLGAGMGQQLVLEQKRHLVWESRRVARAATSAATGDTGWVERLGSRLWRLAPSMPGWLPLQRPHDGVAAANTGEVARTAGRRGSRRAGAGGRAFHGTNGHRGDGEPEESDDEEGDDDDDDDDDDDERGGGYGEDTAEEQPPRVRLVFLEPSAPRKSKRRSSRFHGDEGLEALKAALERGIDDSEEVDSYVIRPKPREPAAAGTAAAATSAGAPGTPARLSTAQLSGGQGGEAHVSPGTLSPPMLTAQPSGSSGARRRDKTVKEGFLLRRLGGVWSRRYFVLSADGQLYWYPTREDVERVFLSGGSLAPDEAGIGQITLRFFAAERSDTTKPAHRRPGRRHVPGESTHYGDERCDDVELARMLPSCAQFELRSGGEVLRLAAQRVDADEWLHALRVQCVLNYAKSPLFSSKEIHVRWMDGKVYTCAVGENITAKDIVKRLCRSRKVQRYHKGAVSEVPLVSDPSEWALYESQRYAPLYGGNAAGGGIAVDSGTNVGGAGLLVASASERAGHDGEGRADGRLSSHRLPADEPILDQVLMRWETAARREYGASPLVPPATFDLQLRKMRCAESGGSGARGAAHISPEEVALELIQARADLLDGRLLNALGNSESLELACVLALREIHVRGPRGKDRAALVRAQRLQKQANPTVAFDLHPNELHTVLPATLLASDPKGERLKKRYELLLRKPLDAKSAHLATRSFEEELHAMTFDQSRTEWLVQDERSKSGLGVSFDKMGQVVVDQKAAESILRCRLADEPLCFGATFSVRVWTSAAELAPQMLVALNHHGLHLYTWERSPRRLASFLYAWQTSPESTEPTVVGWQLVPHQFGADAELAAELGYSATSLVVHVLLPMPSTSGSGPGDKDARRSSATAADGAMTARRRQQMMRRRRAKLVILTREGEDIKARLQAHTGEHAQAQRRARSGGAANTARLSRQRASGRLEPPPTPKVGAHKPALQGNASKLAVPRNDTFFTGGLTERSVRPAGGGMWTAR